MLLTIVIVAVLLVAVLYLCPRVFEYRSQNYFLTFKEMDVKFKSVQYKTRRYHAYYAVYFLYGKRHDTYHYYDDNGVNVYLFIDDEELMKKVTVEKE